MKRINFAYLMTLKVNICKVSIVGIEKMARWKRAHDGWGKIVSEYNGIKERVLSIRMVDKGCVTTD